MKIHFINVGQGNMTLIQTPKNRNILYDCRITEDNKARVFEYLRKEMKFPIIDVFINSHRDADHIQGIVELNKNFSIDEIWDNGVESLDPYCPEYTSYMYLRRRKKNKILKPNEQFDFDNVKIKVLNAQNGVCKAYHDKSIVLRIEFFSDSVLLSGEATAVAWKDFILPKFGDNVQSDILLASHHGANTFFEDSSGNDYIAHLEMINPKITIISVDQKYGLPDEKALKYYEKYSRGYGEKKLKVLTTKKNRTIKFEFNETGSSCNYGL